MIQPGEPDMVGVRMGHDQRVKSSRGFSGPSNSVVQAAIDFLVAETGIHHGPAVAVGKQIDVHMVEPERQLQP